MPHPGDSQLATEVRRLLSGLSLSSDHRVRVTVTAAIAAVVVPRAAGVPHDRGVIFGDEELTPAMRTRVPDEFVPVALIVPPPRRRRAGTLVPFRWRWSVLHATTSVSTSTAATDAGSSVGKDPARPMHQRSIGAAMTV